MSDEQRTHAERLGPKGGGSAERQGLDLPLSATVSGVGHHLATSLASRRRLIKRSAAVGGAVVASHYVKPSLQSLGVPTALAVSGPDAKKDKKDKDDKKDK